MSIAALVVLIVFAVLNGSVWEVVSFSIFGATLITLYSASTLYHSLPWPAVRSVFQVLDHAAIFLLIAGTYTPFMLGNIRGGWGWSIFGIIWALAILGVVLKFCCFEKFKLASLLIYLFMGWLCLFAIKPIVTNVPRISVIFLLIGGIFYTVGVIFFVWKKLPYNHALWHLFVLGGSVCHFFAVLFSV